MSIDILENVEKCQALARNRRFGAVIVYVSIAAFFVSLFTYFFALTSYPSEIAIASVTKYPSLIAGLIVAGPVLAFFMVWIWVKPDNSAVQMFANQKRWEENLESRLPEEISSARFIQYSGDKSHGLMSSIVERGAKVSLLVKDPSTMDLQIQKDKIKLLEHNIRDCANPDNVEVRFYKQHASVRGFSINNKLIGLSWYASQPRDAVSPEHWLYGHSNLHIGCPLGQSSEPANEFFNELFDALWKNASPMWTEVRGRITKGHGVAGAASKHYPEGTIKMQTKPFMERGVDISSYHPATLNIDISPHQMSFVKDPATGFLQAKTLENVTWTDKHQPETFSFSNCWLTYNGRKYAGLIYYPHPETKERHEQKPGIVEVLCVKIDLIARCEEVVLHVYSQEVELKRN